MGIAIFSLLAVAGEVSAQPRRDRREPSVAQIAAQATQPQCSPEDANVARQHRGAGLDAFEAHEWQVCVAEYTVAQARCATPEAGFNLAYCLENLGQLAQAIEGYEALLRGARMPAEVTADQLRRTIDSVRARLPRVVTPVIVPPIGPVCTANTQTDVANCGRCGNHCASGQICSTGTCRVAIATPPVVTPITPNRTLARAFWIGGAVATVTGIALGTVGHLAAADRDTANAQLAAPASQRCQTVNGRLECLAYAPNATRPDSFTGLETPGWIMTGVGAAAVIAGVVLELRGGGHTTEGRPSPTVRPSLALGPDGTPMAGLGGTF